MATITTQPLEAAIDKLSQRTPIGSVLRSAEWSGVPVALRERAQFSAGVESIRVMDHIQQSLLDSLSHNRNEFGVLTDRSKFIADLTKLAEAEGLTPTDPALIGGLQDITSEKRASLIFQQQTESAYGYANWKTGQDPDALETAPAQELFREEERDKKRKWVDKWRSFGGQTFEGDSPGGELQEGMSGIRCIALKNDPIWSNISRFGVPWPPFDFNSGVGVLDVLRSEALDLGLIAPNQQVRPIEESFNANLQASVEGIAPDLLQELFNAFGNQLQLLGNTVRWRPSVP